MPFLRTLHGSRQQNAKGDSRIFRSCRRPHRRKAAYRVHPPSSPPAYGMPHAACRPFPPTPRRQQRQEDAF